MEIPRWTLNTTPVEVCRGHSVLYINQGAEVVAQVWTPSFYGTVSDNGEERYRRARLLAAAPDLLAALKNGIGFYPVPSPQRDAALAAIARAEGGGA